MMKFEVSSLIYELRNENEKSFNCDCEENAENRTFLSEKSYLKVEKLY